MSAKFQTKISNGVHTVGCTGQTVVVFDAGGNELARFKDLKYAYTARFSPDGTKLVVKSAEGRLAVYSLESMSLLKKFRFSKVNYAQNDGCCFSEDGKEFINVERYPDDLHSVVSWYDAETFDQIHTLTPDDLTMIYNVKPYNGQIYALGFERDPATRVADRNFIGILKKTGIVSRREIPETETFFPPATLDLNI